MESWLENNYPVELKSIDITPYKRGNTGTDYITIIDSGKPGPNVMISAIVHGNELCGAIALDFLFQNNIQPICGKLTLAFANYRAYQTFDPGSPMESRFIDEDFNRAWSLSVLDGSRNTIEVKRARELKPFVEQSDFLLDIHSMQNKTPALTICGPLEKGQAFAKNIRTPRYIVSDEGHETGTRMRDYEDFGDPKSEKNSLLIECGQHWEKNSKNVAIDTSLRFLKFLKMVDQDFCNDAHLELPKKQTLIEVTHPITIKNNSFTFAQDFIGFEVINKKGTLLGWDGQKEVLTPFDNCILIMPSKRLYKGQTAVRLGKVIN